MKNDEKYIRKAFKLGAKGKGSTFPNPPVGAVIVKDGRIIGQGWHRKKGEAHAEVNAINDAIASGEEIRGATMFVTLEPCCHYGNTPPCTDAIIAARISRVVISCPDEFDSRVSGEGIRKLKDAGIRVDTGILADTGAELIEQYRVQRQQKRAFLSVKWAQSIDGYIATASGDSRWISGERSRKFAHKLRSEHGAVAVGARTALIDNPRLTVRAVRSHHKPARIVIAGDTKLPQELNVLSGRPRTIAVYNNEKPIAGERASNVELLKIHSGKNFWQRLLEKLPELGIGSILLEGGGKVIASAFKEGVVDRVYCFIAPMIMGEGIKPVGDIGIEHIKNILRLENPKTRRFGQDIMITGRLNNKS